MKCNQGDNDIEMVKYSPTAFGSQYPLEKLLSSKLESMPFFRDVAEKVSTHLHMYSNG